VVYKYSDEWRGASMYKVLIIDDEVLVRVGLKTTIDWELIGFTVVAEASNGEQGYEQYLKHSPDVVITDIKMPRRDGLWLVEKIRKENKDVRILVLTCYDEFSYARKALKVGADDYILKSEVEDEELISVMKSVKNDIDQMKKSENSLMIFKANMNDIKKSLFNDMIKADFILDDKMKGRCKEAGFSINGSKYAFAAVMLNGESCSGIKNKENLKQINHAMRNIIIDQFEDRCIDYIFTSNIKMFTFFMSSDTLNDIELKRMFNSLSYAGQQYFDIFLSIVYTRVFNDFGQAFDNYMTFVKKTQILFYDDKNSAFIKACDEILFEDENVSELKKRYNRMLKEHIGQEKEEDAMGLIYEVTNHFSKRRINPGIVKIFYSNLIGDIFDDYGQLFETDEQIRHHEYYHYKIINSESLVTIVSLMQEFVKKVITQIKYARYYQSKFFIKSAINIIENNYDKKISLEDVANELNLSKHYLCNIFKKETGYNMSYYINKLRIEKAKSILLSTDCRIKEVYEEVGYSNQQYFSKVFKKFTGMTVSEYKESISK
jgi:two-component system response regulator YesN